MKLSTKIILPIILISALLILLNGCFGVPADEEPGVTEVGTSTITGIIAAPCCYTLGEPVSENSGSPEYWCYYCEKDWYLQEGVEVILTSGQEEIATTTTFENGKYTFTGVPPGENYVITAYCPDDEIPLVKDVVPELAKGGSFDAKTTDLVSTSLGLVVDYVTYFAAWDPEDISLDKVIAAKPDFPGFPKFRKLIREVRRVLEDCEDVDADVELLLTLCKAAEEVSESDMGCAPGFTPEPEAEVTGGAPPGEDPEPAPDPDPEPEPGACDGNLAPVIDVVEGVDQVWLNGEPISSGSTLNLVVGTTYEFCVYATDPDNKLPQPLNYSLTGTKDGTTLPDIPMGTLNCYSGTPLVGDAGTYEIFVKVFDGCEPTIWGPITVVVECNEPPEITSQAITSVCLGEDYAYQVTATDPESDPLTYNLTVHPDGMSINSSGLITWTPSSDQIGDNDVTVEVSDGCSSDIQEFKVTVDAGLTGAEFADTYAFIICSDETLDIGSLVTIIPEFGGVPGNAISLTEFLAISGTSMTKNGDTSFSLSGTVISGTSSGAGSGTLTVSYVDPTPDDCGAAEFTIDGTIGVTVDAGLTGAEFADTYAFIICSDETLDIGSLVTIIPEFGGVPGTPVTLTELIALGGYVVKASDGSFSFSGTEIIGLNSGSGSGTLTVTYVDPNHGECGYAEFTIVATIGVTVDAGLTGAEFADTYAFIICSDETLDIGSLVTIIPEFGGVPGNAISLTEFLAISGTSMTKNGDTSFSLSGTVISGTSSGAGSGTLTVSYVDPTPDDCGAAEFTIDGTIGVTVDECLDCFILRIKLGGVTHVYTYDSLISGEVYEIREDLSSASKFQFMINCPQGTVKYNYYRGKSCGGKWESGQDPEEQPIASKPPPEWLADSALINGVFYPAKLTQGLKLCQHGGNILKIQVTESSSVISEFTFTIDRSSQ